MTRAERLLAFIDETKGVPSSWGRDASDCSSWVARWIERERDVRLDMPDYHDETDARAVIDEAGGLVNVWSGILGRAGISTAYAPELGDVGVIQMTDHQTGCIFGNHGTALLRSDKGVAVLGARRWTVLAAFTV